MSTVLSGRRKDAAFCEANEFIACEHVAADLALRPRNNHPQGDHQHEQHRQHHQRWWHLTVLAVARIMSTVDGLVAIPREGKQQFTENPGRDGRVMLGSAEAAAIAALDANNKDCGSRTLLASPPEQEAIGGVNLTGGSARVRALLAIRVNLAAAEKMGAKNAVGTSRGSISRYPEGGGGLARAIECMNAAIELDPSLPEMYVERGGLLARLATVDASDGNVGGNLYIARAAADFATALRLDGDIRRYRPGFSRSMSCLSDVEVREESSQIR